MELVPSQQPNLDGEAQELLDVARGLVLRLLALERANFPAPEPLEKLLTAEEVGALFGRSDEFVNRLRREGLLTGVQISERTFLYEPEVVRQFIKAGGIKAA